MLIPACLLLSQGLGSVSISASAQGLPGTSPSYVLRSESRLWLEGTSTLHPYASTATVMHASLTLASGEPAPSLTPTPNLLYEAIHRGRLQTLNVTIPVKGLKSGKSRLDKNMYEALRADQYPSLTFHLLRYQVHPETQEGMFGITATGRLVVAGEERTIELDAEVVASPNGLEIRGNKALFMTDFGIEPPTMMFGALKTHDRVIIHYAIFFVPSRETGRGDNGHPSDDRVIPKGGGIS
ncbi:MAG: YceI family protein [Elusimicrobia bacterium]|nr:YceI family protein [Elusimicrobiota bacterium]